MIGRSKLILIAIIVLLFAGGVFWYDREKSNQVTRGDLLRFHVIANSDSVYDQKIKLLVRDEVIKYMEPYLSHAQTAQEAASIVQKQSPAIEKVADNCLGAHNVGYSARVDLGNFNFPVKAYGNLVLPEGKYQAMRVVLGEGEGQNWWCVLFPPLCFIDISNSIAVREKEPEPLEETHQVSVKPVQVEIRFRILDWWKKVGGNFTL
ncbi:MAG: stage II sporulation protein R [Desulfitobacteriaceae bacterium]|nr:stage II sporulation protein R [Desulfitobacteriaceae bacterium]MDD4752672.1 stage II sporulation protein R [Desulfitobacteriaceae bacterium]